jgi:hypothetical protein
MKATRQKKTRKPIDAARGAMHPVRQSFQNSIC